MHLVQPAGKLTPSGAADQPLEGNLNQVHFPESTVYTSPISLLSGFCLTGSLNGVDVSMLVNTAAAVLLLQLDVWEQIMVSNPVVLQPCTTLRLLGAGGEPLTVHGRAQVSLKLGSNCFLINTVVVSSLTSQAILGLDFLVDQQASISLPNRTLQLKEAGCNIPLEVPPIVGDPITKCYLSSGSTYNVPVCLTRWFSV